MCIQVEYSMVDYFIFIFVCFVFYPYFFLFDDFLKMFTLNEEQRWYIVNEWKKGSKSFSRIARFLNCHISRIYRVINYYRCPHNVNYGHDVGRPPALDSKQIKQLDRAMQKNDRLRTIPRYRLSLGYRPRKSLVKVKNNNINEQKRYQFALLHYRARIDNCIFEDECYVGLRSTQQIVWCRRGQSTPKKEISSLHT
jgi:hypothetical protein